MRSIAAALAVLVISTTALAQPKKDKDDDDDDDSSDTDKTDKTDKDKAKKFSKKADDAKKTDDTKKTDDDADTKPDAETKPDQLQKQDLNGHDLGTDKKDNAFEKDRFFVDKTDSEKTEKGTLVQGSITSTSFLYSESGGAYTAPAGSIMGAGNDAGQYSRLFTDLRLQTDLRHIGGGKWDARFDGRIRYVNSETNLDPNSINQTHVQSGFNGENEYELREAWIVRNGAQSDIFIGRQFVPDLGAIKIDGLRVDYASSQKFTYIGFAGLYPLRGSRSLTTDYVDLKNADGTSAGQFTGAGGFGAAYRTPNAYGSFGGVVLAPLGGGEDPRVYGTATGYWRYGSQLDIYHFAIIDLLGSNAVNGGLTNLSGGINYKPSQRLRLTANYNRVDTDTLNVQANAFLSSPDTSGGQVLSNELFITRLATTQVRGGVSAGLGELNRFEISTSVAYRYRPSFLLQIINSPNTETIPLAKSVEVYGSIVDRKSVKDMRLGVDGVRTFGVGSVAYQRNELTAFRVFASHELASGHGEWEGEVGYSASSNIATAMGGSTMCLNPQLGQVDQCFGSSNGTLVQVGGTLYYRFNRDWLGIASLFVNRTTITSDDGAGNKTNDPAITGITSFGRLAYRF